ncbi:MAG: hypothetical protein KF914_06085 [Rhizobiaceae bacterium]|nr:hypothetical protein [Rhizobiaceae bacterium]
MQEDITDGNASRSVNWFAAGALSVAALVALFLYADGFFSMGSDGTQADEPRLIIEAKK